MSLARHDAQIYFDGGWMLPRGQEDTLRDSLIALRKLPRVQFLSAPETREQQPLTLRTVSRNDETVAYLFNNSAWPVSVRVEVRSEGRVSARFAGNASSANLDGDSNWNVTIPPYGLTTAQFDRRDVVLNVADASLPGELADFVVQRLQDVQRRAAALKNPAPIEAQNLGFDQSIDRDGNEEDVQRGQGGSKPEAVCRPCRRR